MNYLEFKKKILYYYSILDYVLLETDNKIILRFQLNADANTANDLQLAKEINLNVTVDSLLEPHNIVSLEYNGEILDLAFDNNLNALLPVDLEALTDLNTLSPDLYLETCIASILQAHIQLPLSIQTKWEVVDPIKLKLYNKIALITSLNLLKDYPQQLNTNLAIILSSLPNFLSHYDPKNLNIDEAFSLHLITLLESLASKGLSAEDTISNLKILIEKLVANEAVDLTTYITIINELMQYILSVCESVDLKSYIEIILKEFEVGLNSLTSKDLSLHLEIAWKVFYVLFSSYATSDLELEWKEAIKEFYLLFSAYNTTSLNLTNCIPLPEINSLLDIVEHKDLNLYSKNWATIVTNLTSLNPNLLSLSPLTTGLTAYLNLTDLDPVNLELDWKNSTKLKENILNVLNIENNLEVILGISLKSFEDELIKINPEQLSTDLLLPLFTINSELKRVASEEFNLDLNWIELNFITQLIVSSLADLSSETSAKLNVDVNMILLYGDVYISYYDNASATLQRVCFKDTWERSINEFIKGLY